MRKHSWLLCALALIGCGAPGSKADAGAGGGGGGGIGGGGGGQGGGGGGSSAAVDQYIAGVAGALCDKLAACNQIDPAWKAECVRIYGAMLFGDLRQSVATGEQSFNAAIGEECVKIARADEACDGLAQTHCPGLTRPQVPSNGQCNDRDDCATPGDECAWTSSAATECDGRCLASGGPGQPCTDGYGCVTGYYCSYPASTCAQSGGPGASCTSNSQCDPALSRCDDATSRCVALPGPGQPCYGSSCASTAYCAFSTCVARGGADAGCTYSSECLSAYHCRGGHCTAPSGLGGACFSSPDCQAGLRCAAGVCRAPLAEGEPCAGAASACATELVCDDVSWTCRRLSYAAPGSACSNSVTCQHSFCDGKVTHYDGDAGVPGTCRTDWTGQPCYSSYSCKGATYCDRSDGGYVGGCVPSGAGAPCREDWNCRSADYCGRAADGGEQCQPRPGAGQACELSGSYGVCVRGYRCVPTGSDAGAGKCVAPAGGGSSCASDSTGYQTCKVPYGCINGVCTAVGGEGEPCYGSLGCYAGACDYTGGGGFVCGEPADDGAGCSTGHQCRSGTCDGRTYKCISACN